jgi:2-methylisocitrate lyase-like PEP mutase family enzyme
MKPKTTLRTLVKQRASIIAPGAHDVISARMIEDLGFPSVYVGGQAAAATIHGIPDHSLITTTELWDHARRIATAVKIPVICDVDDAGSTPLNVQRTVELFESAGVAAIHIEDHIPGKHFHDPSGALIPIEAMVQRLRAALEARQDHNFLIIARCDGCVVDKPLDEVIERAKAYAATGSDLLFIPRLPLPEVQRVKTATGVPLMAITPANVTNDQMRDCGVTVSIYHNHGLLACLQTFRELLGEIRTQGAILNAEERLLPMEEFNRLLGTPDAIMAARRYGILEDESPDESGI